MEIPGAVDSPGGGHGAVEVAGVHRVKMDILEPSLQRLNLSAALDGDQPIVPAMAPAVEVALRLRMANEINGGHYGVPSFYVTKAERRR